MVTAMKAGQALSDPVTAPLARAEILSKLYLNLTNFGHKQTWAANHKLPDGYRYVANPVLLPRQSKKNLKLLRREEAKWEKLRAENADAPDRLKSIREEIDNLNAEYKRLQKEGFVINRPISKQQNPTEKQIMEAHAAPLLEIERTLKALEKEKSQVRDRQKIHSVATRNLSEIMGKRNKAELKSYRDMFKDAAKDDHTYAEFLNEFGKRMTTTNLRHAAMTHDGKVIMVPLHDAQNLALETLGSSKFVRWVWKNPTRLWKIALLGYTPRVVTNNAIGNWSIYALREGLDRHSIPAIYDAIRLTHGDKVARESLGRVTPFKKDNWLWRNFSDELGNVFGTTLADEPGKGVSRAAQGLYPLVHKTADEPVRAAAIVSYLRKSKEVKALQARGLSFDRAANKALRKNPELRTRAAEHARSIAGDYFSMQPWERVLRDLVPFYLWDRHIVKSTGNMIADTPGRVAVLQQISNQGVERTEEILGNVPEFLRGAVPLWGGDGRENVLLTHSLNPFATIGELASAGEGLLTGGGVRPGASVFSQTNPFVTGSIEWASGQSLLTGADKPAQGGLVSSVLGNTATALPWVRLGQSLKDGTYDRSKNTGRPLLFEHGPAREGLKLIGTPIQSVLLKQAEELARREQGKKKAKRPRQRSPFATP
jgi:hypothetical protein